MSGPSSDQKPYEGRAAYYKSILAGVLDGVLVMDAYGTILQCNRSLTDIFGWEPKELEGMNVKTLMPEPHHSQHDDYLARYRASGETWILGTTREFQVVKKSGELFHCELSVSRVDAPGAKAPIFCGVFRDITSRIEIERRIHASELRFRAVFDQEYQLVVLLDREGRILEANDTAEELAGVPRAEMTGLPFWEMPYWRSSSAVPRSLEEPAARSEADKVRGWIQAVQDGGFVRSQVSILDPQGRLVTLDLSIKATQRNADEEALLMVEARDITELKRAQATETSMLRALAELGESAAILAHEIKNPITSVNLALRSAAKEMGAEEQALLEELVERMQVLERKLRGTLSFAKPIDIKLALCDPDLLCDEVAHQHRPEFAERDVELDLDVMEDCPSLLADEPQLEVVLSNLLKNALEAVEKGGRVKFSVKTVKESSATNQDHVVFAVEDDGPGVPPALATKIFHPFATTKASGTGIGLALCRRLVTAMGGTISMGNSALGGARFEICLPAADSDYEHRRTPPGTDP